MNKKLCKCRKWISVESKLPESLRSVLIYHTKLQTIYIATRYNDVWLANMPLSIRGFEICSDHVRYWMELPEFPKDDSR